MAQSKKPVQKEQPVMKRRLNGIVVSDAMQKTVVVRVDLVRVHPKYHIRFTVSRRYQAHDERNEYKNGDTVVIEACRPLSRHKHWRVISKRGTTK